MLPVNSGFAGSFNVDNAATFGFSLFARHSVESWNLWGPEAVFWTKLNTRWHMLVAETWCTSLAVNHNCIILHQPSISMVVIYHICIVSHHPHHSCPRCKSVFVLAFLCWRWVPPVPTWLRQPWALWHWVLPCRCMVHLRQYLNASRVLILSDIVI